MKITTIPMDSVNEVLQLQLSTGGIASLEDAEKFIALGADRLGTSRVVKIAKGLENDGTY